MRILIVEDDQDLARALSYRLKKEQMEITLCAEGAEGLSVLGRHPFDLVILDRMLPGMDGTQILERMRALGNTTPVLLLTAMDGVRDRVVGLDAGADDYLVKPFAMDELLARIRALARRQTSWNPYQMVKAGDLTLDVEKLSLHCAHRSVTLSKRECGLMEYLMRNVDQTLTRGLILDRVWSDAFVEEGSLEAYIHFLRRRLKEIHSGCVILTQRGVGYRLCAPE
ncbi:MAG: response regulator transcription factor [Firmicutes bacterium]|nr:response regulator transcription factor [Bacillota bacterium]